MPRSEWRSASLTSRSGDSGWTSLESGDRPAMTGRWVSAPRWLRRLRSVLHSASRSNAAQSKSGEFRSEEAGSSPARITWRHRAMTVVSLHDLAATGNLGPITTGSTRASLEAAFGPPEATGGFIRKERRPLIWKYGDVEFH